MSVSTKMSTEAAIVRLAKMTVPQLQQRHAELFGEESRTPHRQYLFRKIAATHVLKENDGSTRSPSLAKRSWAYGSHRTYRGCEAESLWTGPQRPR